jgi:hypothetical protein
MEGMTDLILMAVVPGVLLTAVIADVWMLLDLMAHCWVMLMGEA